MNVEAPPNPLAQLCTQMGLSADFLARAIDLEPNNVAAALRIYPTEPIATYVKLLHELQTRVRLAPAPPIALWVNNRAVHKLIGDARWRQDAKLCPFPRNTLELCAILKRLRDQGMTNEKIARYMQVNFIPTGNGGLQWDENMVSRRLNPKGPSADRAVRYARSDEWRKAFRHLVVSHLLVRIFPADPAAAMRYGLEVIDAPERTIIRGKERMPACVREWAMESLRAIRWFPAGEWGIGQAPDSPPAKLPRRR